MATRGRKPKPTAMKELEGNPGKHPLNTSEPKPNKKAPACPKWLEPEAKKPEPIQAGRWKCKCGAMATGKFCPECGSPKPLEDGWTCTCVTVNQGKFCQNCGAKKPSGAPLYRCDKCGWQPEDPKNPPKFCPECGDPFDENDVQ